jgi:hypothetical protein
LRHDRDLNAASNVKAEGLRILKESIEAEVHPDSLNGRGADVRLPTRERLVSKVKESPALARGVSTVFHEQRLAG